MKTETTPHSQPFFRRVFSSPYLDGLMHLLYPAHCLICETELTRKESSTCSICTENLHFTGFERYEEPTPLDQLFWGRVSLAATFALLYYEKSNSSKKLLTALKYQHRPDVGIGFGQLIAKRIQHVEAFQDVDCLIPVPIHPKKEFIRGYNQSAMLASGIGETMAIPVFSHLIRRTEHSKSQTALGRFRRWDNVQNRFLVKPSIRNYQHIALIDDVVTTGSTLESIIRLIHDQAPGIRISVISLALAK